MPVPDIHKREIELLAPAKDAAIAIEAVKHGADAVYIGADKFGARFAASNSTVEIASAVDFAHRFNAKVYVTVNTILKDSELKDAERLIRDLYRVGVDALIIQDLGILRMDIPPIALHASTQCDIRTPGKALFLEKLGFSQIVLARELSLEEIVAIRDEVTVPLEAFVHGALCVSYSGKCHASMVLKNRSANRGECAQICRLPFDMVDAKGEVIVKDRHLLSLRDLNHSRRIEDMLRAGVSSFKIEGRLKDAAYVKNVVAYYRQKIDKIISDNAELYTRASCGKEEFTFTPVLDKSFNRGFTGYFIDSRNAVKEGTLASFGTPKSMGEPVGRVRKSFDNKIMLSSGSTFYNGDGISYFNSKGEYCGMRVNVADGARLTMANNANIAPGTFIYRTYDKNFNDILSAESGKRLIAVDMALSKCRGGIVLSVKDEMGNTVDITKQIELSEAKNPQGQSQASVLSKLGGTNFYLKSLHTVDDIFIPSSVLASLRRDAIKWLVKVTTINYKFSYRRSEDYSAQHYDKSLGYADNVSNRLAVEVYKDHGVLNIEPAMEISDHSKLSGEEILMTTRYCLLRELGKCKKNGGNIDKLNEPLFLESGNIRLCLEFDCKHCEMLIRKAR